MFRLPVRIAALAFAAGTLGGCGMMGGGDTAVPGPDRAADISPMAPDVESNVRQVQALRMKGDTAGATRIISQLMLVYPDDPRVVGEYGKLLVQLRASADAVRSSSQEGMTLPRRQTSAMSARSSLKRCSSGNASMLAFLRMSKPSA